VHADLLTGEYALKEVNKKKNVRNILMDQKGSALDKYKALTTGDVSMPSFIFYELITWLLGARSGALGILLRKKLYKGLFKSCGRNIIIGRNCIFRHPSRISLGDNVVIDDNCIIDARGCEDEGLVIGSGAMINRNCAIQSKGGDITIGEGVSLGADSQLVSWGGITIGDGSAIAGGCYISAGTYKMTDFSTPIAERQPYTSGPVSIGENVWVATRATILDNVEIGDNAVISAGAVVTGNVNAKAVVHGNPAKVVFQGR
jgi:acetyltransferase-like isoleucine patch superfamily enzyme